MGRVCECWLILTLLLAAGVCGFSVSLSHLIPNPKASREREKPVYVDENHLIIYISEIILCPAHIILHIFLCQGRDCLQ